MEKRPAAVRAKIWLREGPRAKASLKKGPFRVGEDWRRRKRIEAMAHAQ